MDKPKIPKILWHHGTCDCCMKRHILVCHFGYDTQPIRDYRICENCLKENNLHIQNLPTKLQGGFLNEPLHLNWKREQQWTERRDIP